MSSVDVANDLTITDWSDFLDKSKTYLDDHWMKKMTPDLSLSDFIRMRTIGIGSFGRVVLMKQDNTNNFYAAKILDKLALKEHSQIDHALYEKRVLQSIRLPFAVNLEFFLQDNSYLYFFLPFVSGGELFTHLRKLGKFDDSQTKFYAAQVLLGLEYLHYLDLLYRDLKPENILLESDGYLKLTDFGFCKVVKGRTYTLCGTPEYIAPEVILNQGYGKSVDYWALGVLIYEMAAGYPPFYSNNTLKIYEKVTQGKYRNAPHFSNDLKDIIKDLLQPDIANRLGVMNNGVYDIKEHKYFYSIPWLGLVNKKVEPPYAPKHTGAGDTTNFDHYDEECFKVSSQDKFHDDFVDF